MYPDPPEYDIDEDHYLEDVEPTEPPEEPEVEMGWQPDTIKEWKGEA